MKLLTYPVRFLVNKSLKRKFRNEIPVRQSSNVLAVEEADNQLNILDLPEELLVNILEYLDILEIIKCERVCRSFLGVIINLSVYRGILDRKCRLRNINNYMIIPTDLRAEMTASECSEYYKKRLYHYVYVRIYSKWLEMYKFKHTKLN